MNDAPAIDGLSTDRLTGQTVVVIGGTSGIGLETARQARAAGANLVLTGRDGDRLERAGREVGALQTARLDLSDPDGLEPFFAGLATSIEHVLVTGGGPMYVPIADLDLDAALRVLDEHLLGALRVARACAGRVRAGGSLTFITGTDARRPNVGSSVAAILAAAMPAVVANIAVEFAPIRANAVAAGYVDTPLSARILGDDLERRRAELRARLPIRRIVGPVDVASTVVHLMINTAVTGATYDVDGGQQILS
ncbi:MAG: alcohol dehydrogenase [Pseudonocardiales bacterium]|nr:alcohol dehydrogenase [Pseudonocardiales bacterium]